MFRKGRCNRGLPPLAGCASPRRTSYVWFHDLATQPLWLTYFRVRSGRAEMSLARVRRAITEGAHRREWHGQTGDR